MMFMTARVDIKKILIAVTAAGAVILALVLLFSGNDSAASATSATVSGNDARVQFLKSFGWEVDQTPTDSGQVKIPQDNTRVYARYNELQKSQGYDLTPYAGKTVMRYVYQIQNYPDATDPVYATVLIYKNQVIGGDVTNTAAKGMISGFKMPQTTPQSTVSEPQTAETTLPTE